MARMRPDDRRDAIVSAALSVMQRRGIAATTVRDVAAEMGTSSGLIHHYFASMDELVASAFERAAGRDLAVTEALTARHNDPLDRLAVFVTSYGRGDDDGGLQLWLDAWAEAARRPVLRATSRRLNEGWQRVLRDIVSDGVRCGHMKCDDPEGAAWRLLSLLDGLALQVVAHGDSLTTDQVEDWSHTAVENELRLTKGCLKQRLGEIEARLNEVG